MEVLEEARGLRAGEFLLRAMIARAQEMEAETLYLLSNRKSAAAVHLYEAGVQARHGNHAGLRLAL
jgi:N-acetylglutamate synthase-like GNAT family acetyltransferase